MVDETFGHFEYLSSFKFLLCFQDSVAIYNGPRLDTSRVFLIPRTEHVDSMLALVDTRAMREYALDRFRVVMSALPPGLYGNAPLYPEPSE